MALANVGGSNEHPRKLRRDPLQPAAAALSNYSTTQRAQGRARHKALRALEANQSLNYLWRPPLGARAPKTEFLRLNQRKHTTHALQRTTGTTPTSVTHWEFTGGVWEVACSSGALGEAGMGPGHRQNGGQRQEPHLDATEGHFVGRGVPSWLVLVWGVFGNSVGSVGAAPASFCVCAGATAAALGTCTHLHTNNYVSTVPPKTPSNLSEAHFRSLQA